MHVPATRTVSSDHSKRIGDTPVLASTEEDEVGSEFVGELVGAVVVVVVVVVAVGEAEEEAVAAVMARSGLSVVGRLVEEGGFSVESLLLRLVGEVELLSRRSELFLFIKSPTMLLSLDADTDAEARDFASEATGT